MAEPSLNEVRAHVLEQHEMLRTLLATLENAAHAVMPGNQGTRDVLRRAVRSLTTAFAEHLVFEETRLAPILRSLDNWGPIRVARMCDEHREQRLIAQAILADSEGETKSALELADDACWLVGVLRRDMASEESHLLGL